jgi:hypothetical protein
MTIDSFGAAYQGGKRKAFGVRGDQKSQKSGGPV